MQYPKRSEIWTIDLGIAAKLRPCLIISIPFKSSEYSLIAYVPITKQQRDSRFLLPVPTTIKSVEGFFNIQGLGAIDHHAFQKKLESVGPEIVIQIEGKIRLWLGMN